MKLFKQKALAAAALLALMTGPGVVRAETSTEVKTVDHASSLDELGLNGPGLQLVKEMLAAAPKDHKLEVECISVKPLNAHPPYRYASRITTRNAAGQRDGQERELSYQSKPSRIAQYRDDKLHGKEQRFDVRSGDLKREIPWVEGKMHGVMRSYHPNGEQASESPYENGKVHGAVRSYSIQGGLTRVATYVRGQREGDTTDYWVENPGAVQKVVPYRAGKVHGVAKGFYLNGKPKWERPFRGNLEHGKETQYAPDGTVERSVYWLEGDRVSEDEYRTRAEK